MQLVGSKAELECWFSQWGVAPGDEMNEPSEYPAFARRRVIDWNMQYEGIEFLYRSDLVRMISQIDDCKDD